MSYPRRKAAFDAWHKAMVAGATVDKPDYGKTSTKGRSRKTSPGTKTRHKRRKRRKRNAKKET